MPKAGGILRAVAIICVTVMCLMPRAGLAQPADPVALLEQVTKLAREGKFDAAIEVANRLVTVIEKMAGKRHPLYLAQIATLGDLHTMKGDNEGARRLHLQALKLREEILGPRHADVAASLASLATVDINLARYDEAETSLRRALAIREKALERSHPDYGFTFVNLGRLYATRSRFDEAEAAFSQALTLFRKHLPADHVYFPVTINNLAEAKRQYGRYAEAEALMRRELAITERTLGADHPSIAVSLNNLGTLMTQRGRPKDAETLLRRALAIEEGRSGSDHPTVAATLNNLGDAVSWQGRADEAEALFRRSVAIRERVHGSDHPALAVSLDNLAAHLFTRQRFPEAEALARRSLAIREAHLPAGHPELGVSYSNLGTLLDRLGRHGEARPMHERSVTMREAALGANHPEVAQALNNLGGNRLDERDWAGAYQAFRRGAAIWTDRRAGEDGAADPDSELRRFADPFLGLVWAAFELGQDAAGPDRQALSEEAFAALQRASLSDAADAIAKLSARIAAGSGALGDLVRERQDIATSLAALDRTLIAAIAGAPEQRSKEAEMELRAKADALAARLAAIDAELAARFPEFAGLARSQPRSIVQLQKTLRDGEALYTVALTRGGSFAWLITRDEARWYRVPRTNPEIEDDVAALRCGVDPVAWDDPKSRCSVLTGRSYGEADRAAGRSPPFDLDRAHVLYRSLFGGAEDLVRDRQLILMPTGALTKLPFHLLVTEKPAPTANDVEAYRRAPWLARRNAIVVLPTLGALDMLRGRQQRRTDASEPYFGIGNPLLEGPDARYASLAKAARDHASCARPGAANQLASLRGARAVVPSILTSSGVADPGFLRKQPPLPETAFELCTVASQLGTGASGAVMLGRDASEATLKALDKRGELRKYRVLHFATHGAMAGEVVGSAEPGLLLTPPQAASLAEDGYLSASEIALFKLDADLVILSACNTAAGGQGKADETLSGLARSFFYAGARALLVSHWAVDSAATVRLITAALAGQAANSNLTHAEALRRAMIELIDKGEVAETHPAFWAPFVVVGGAG